MKCFPSQENINTMLNFFLHVNDNITVMIYIWPSNTLHIYQMPTSQIPTKYYTTPPLHQVPSN